MKIEYFQNEGCSFSKVVDGVGGGGFLPQIPDIFKIPDDMMMNTSKEAPNDQPTGSLSCHEQISLWL